MALILCVKKGKPFFVGSRAVVIREIISPTHFIVSVKKKVFDVTAEESVEILPNVHASCGGSCPENFVKIVLEAPKNIFILREHIYKQRRYAERHPNEIIRKSRPLDT